MCIMKNLARQANVIVMRNHQTDYELVYSGTNDIFILFV